MQIKLSATLQWLRGPGPMRCLVVDNALCYEPIQGFDQQSDDEYQLREVLSKEYKTK